MKQKLHTVLITLVMCLLGLGGATAQTASDTYLDVTKYSTIDAASKTLKAVDKLYSYDATNNILVISVYGAYQNSGQKWVTVDGKGSSSRTWDAQAPFNGSAYYHTNTQTNPEKTATANSARTYKFEVTNVTKISALGGKLSSTKPLVLTVYECGTDGKVTETVAGTSTVDGTTTSIATVDNLDPTKIYSAQVNSNQKNNVDFYEIAFYANAGSVAPSSKVTIGESGYATYVTEGAVDFSKTEGVAAYKAKYDAANQSITLTKIEGAVPAGTAVVLKGNEGTYNLTSAESGEAVADNDLVAATADVTADGTQWGIANIDGVVGFAKVTTGTVIAKGKAYLIIPATSTAKEFIGFTDSSTTGIKNIIAADKADVNAPIYNLAGQRVGKNYKGVVIQNGKKRIQ